MEEMKKLFNEKIKCAILAALRTKELSFSELLKEAELRDHGQLNYHLKRLHEHGLIERDDKYKLTKLGESMTVYLNQLQLKVMYPVPVAICLVQNTKGEILIMKRARTPFRGYWIFPGGKVEYGESIKEAAGRELFEETGLKLDCGRVIGFYPSRIHKDDELSFHAHVVPVITEIVPDTVTIRLTEEHEEFRFVSLDEIDSYPIMPTNKEILSDMKKKGFQFKEVSA